MNYTDFFKHATGIPEGPYNYQKKLAEEPWPDLLEIPTGMGKTAAVVLAWLYKRRIQQDLDTPRRLVYCLPMRVLVEQTERNARDWLNNLGLLGDAGESKVSVHLLMGGESDIKSWVEYPEEEMIILGTQDMLLSRALMRGYGISRYRWPIDFALLHNDVLWVYDEIQLMGPALPTSTQLAAFRRDARIMPARNSRSLWVSATLRSDWLNTIDFRPYLQELRTLNLSENEKQSPVIQKRWMANKRLAQAQTRVDAENSKKGASEYINALAGEIGDAHQPGTQTLVILNRVERVQDLYTAIGKKLKDVPRLLLHARFRPMERRAIENMLRKNPDDKGRIIIATQAIEAGVDISSRTLFTELAPWASLVQRFGRCNRGGEHAIADIRWIDISDDADESAPYQTESLTSARSSIEKISSASPADLPGIEEAFPVSQILRRKDFLELFNADADLSGFDVDISPYIRDTGSPQLQLFWREMGGVVDDGRPLREELCPAGIAQVKTHLAAGKKSLLWDALAKKWIEVRAERARPGMVLMLDASEGGYDPELGFVAKSRKPVAPVDGVQTNKEDDSYDADALVAIGRWVSLSEHLQDVENAARHLCKAVAVEQDAAEAVVIAGRWHDVGKAHPAFQRALTKGNADSDSPPGNNMFWAKSAGTGRLKYEMLVEGKPQARPYFRHELASALVWLEQQHEHPHCDLIAYLIAAHHGKVRMGLRALPNERQPDDDRLFARGVWHGDVLPQVQIGSEVIPETTLRLNLMRLGESVEQGRSWTARTQALLSQYGPFELAWLETLVRLADWRASAMEASAADGNGK